jgi:hypothetical protein
MTSNSTKLPVLGSDAEIAVGLLDEWFDPIEAGLRDRVTVDPSATTVPVERGTTEGRDWSCWVKSKLLP